MNYLLYGSESFKLRKRREQIVTDILGDDEINLHVYRGDEYTIDEVIADCLMVPFLAAGKIVILENPEIISSDDPKGTDENKLIEYLSKPDEMTTVIIYCDKPFDRKKVFRKLIKLMESEQYETVSKDEFFRQVRYDVEKKQIRITEKGMNELLQRLPYDLENWEKEAAKLSCYPGEIDETVVRKLVYRPLEDNVFELSNAVVNRNVSRAISVYHDLNVFSRDNQSALIGLLAYQFRFMSQVRNLNESGMAIPDIAKRYNTVDYRIKKTLQGCAGLNSKQLLAILDDLSNLDQQIKTGQINPTLGLELFIIRACNR
ncbi:MAG: DNA polymerase III subunit delta [Erysipelotrichaceae bacterium]|nr:DNA polymerase III subunit delta [Erysipelotrichaceae bacterium]